MFDEASLHALNSISWSFPGTNSAARAPGGLFDARSIHWYPATYIPEIPYSLIEILSRPGDRVLDPFAGVGTTLWQAQSLGRDAFGCELTVVGHQICEGIWTLLSEDTDLGAAQEDVLSVLQQWRQLDIRRGFVDTPRGQLLQPWFSAGTFDELAFLAEAESMVNTHAAYRLLRLAISSALASVSEQRRGWGCIADNMQPKEAEMAAAPASRRAVEKVAKRVGAIVQSIAYARSRIGFFESHPVLTDDLSTHLFEGDCVSSGALERKDFYDLVVTSPPYPAMVDYSTAQRLSYYWSGVVPEQDVSKEIGARRRRFSSRALADYRSEMENAFGAIAESMKLGGLLAMVVPEFSTGGADDPRSTVLREALDGATDTRLVLRWEQHRVLPSNRRHLNQKWTSLRREQIQVYERVG